MSRLTAELISRAPVFINPVKDREIDLRGNKISLIENLGVTQDQYDTIDLTDNEIKKLENFPRLERLKTLLVSNNRVARFTTAAELQQSLPSLTTLILNNNRLTIFSDLEPLAGLSGLKCLSLMDNPVAKRLNYRLFVIHLLPKLKLLDFRKVKQREIEEAKKIFGEYAKKKKKEALPAPMAIDLPNINNTTTTTNTNTTTTTSISSSTASSMIPKGMPTTPNIATKPNPSDKTTIRKAIEQVSNMDDLFRLENSLMTGNLPATSKK